MPGWFNHSVYRQGLDKGVDLGWGMFGKLIQAATERSFTAGYERAEADLRARFAKKEEELCARAGWTVNHAALVRLRRQCHEKRIKANIGRDENRENWFHAQEALLDEIMADDRAPA